MSQSYVIGDLQGCYASFLRLLDKIDFDDTQDTLYLCGDIVARGEDSLATLRLVKRLADKGRLQSVLGNHDITLIAAWLGVIPPKPKDGTLPILQAPDCDVLLHWLRCRPFLLDIGDKYTLTHAGIPPIWSVDKARRYAKELSVQFGGSLKQLKRLMPHLYDKKPKIWSENLQGFARLAAISDYFTRMRLCTDAGELDLAFKSGLAAKMPDGFAPWFSYPRSPDRVILFGHWAALEAKADTAHSVSLDGGCVWGKDLVAYRLSDGVKIRAECKK